MSSPLGPNCPDASQRAMVTIMPAEMSQDFFRLLLPDSISQIPLSSGSLRHWLFGQQVTVFSNVLFHRGGDGFAETKHEFFAFFPIRHRLRFQLAEHLAVLGDFLKAIIEYGLDRFPLHQMRKTHRGKEFRSNLVTGARVFQRFKKELPAFFGNLIDLAIRFAFLRYLFAADKSLLRQGRQG